MPRLKNPNPIGATQHMNDSVSGEPIRWGILGTGDVCRQFTHDLQFVEGAQAYAVGSRRTETAQRFGLEHEIPVQYGSYESLVADATVDIIYVGSPHSYHLEHTLLCLEAGKHVLCEKPMGLTPAEIGRMIAAASETGCFLMEALWTFFFPAINRVRSWIDENRIGRPRMLRADFHFNAPYDPSSRLYDPALGGGALLDIGVYPVALAHLVFKKPPARIWSAVDYAESGVDRLATVMFQYADGALANMSFGFGAEAPQSAFIAGEDGVIELPEKFYQPDTAILAAPANHEEFVFEREGYGYEYEARHVTHCIREGLAQSDRVPWTQSQEIADSLERIRACWAVHPAE